LKTGFIILCRYSSTRLPGKILKEIAGKPLIVYIVERVSRVSGLDNVVIATSDKDTDKPITEWCKSSGLNLFCGDLDNVAKRFLDCAKAFELDFAFRINGDNLFADVNLIREAYQLSQTKQYHFISNVDKRTFPKGMSIEGVDINLYEKNYPNFSIHDQEHVMTYLYRHINEFNYFFIYNKTNPELAGVQLAIDTPADFDLATKIVAHFYNDQAYYGLNDISKILNQINSEYL
jgi:spore coat polysaccharide biosynthesis protein SpsF